MTTIGIVIRPGMMFLPDQEVLSAKATAIINGLRDLGYSLIINQNDQKFLKVEPVDLHKLVYLFKLADIILSFGGDGTMLGVARLAASADSNAKLLGINFGHVGFITDLPIDVTVENLHKIIQKEHVIEERTLLSVSGFCAKALNDVVIKSTNGKLIDFTVLVDDVPTYVARADGLIVATPTGSTAYSLSGGGSIIQPTASVFQILPIMPQLSVCRSMVIPDTSEIIINVSGVAKVFNDGVELTDLHSMAPTLYIRKSVTTVKFMHPNTEDHKYNYFDMLRSKLGVLNPPSY